jgi:hypothetical protein
MQQIITRKFFIIDIFYKLDDILYNIAKEIL